MADLNAEMLKVAQDVAAAESGDTPAPVQEEPVQEAGEVPAEPQEAAAEEQPEVEGEKPETEEEVEAKPEEPTAEEKAKSSYQRLNRKYVQAQADLAKAKDEAHEALVIANEWRQRGIAALKEMRRVIADAQRVGYRRDPKDDRLLAAEMREASHGLQQKASETRAAAKEQAEVKALADSYTSEAADLAKKYFPNAKPAEVQGEILRAYAAMVESSNGEVDVSMEEVAKVLHGYKNRGQGARAQLEKNRQAISTIKPGGLTKPRDYKANQDDMKAFLVENGLA